MINSEQFLKDYNEFLEYYGKRAVEYSIRTRDFRADIDFEPITFEFTAENIIFELWNPFYGQSQVELPKDTLFLSDDNWEKYILDKVEEIKIKEEIYTKERLAAKKQQYERLKKELGYES